MLLGNRQALTGGLLLVGAFVIGTRPAHGCMPNKPISVTITPGMVNIVEKKTATVQATIDCMIDNTEVSGANFNGRGRLLFNVRLVDVDGFGGKGIPTDAGRDDDNAVDDVLGTTMVAQTRKAPGKPTKAHFDVSFVVGCTANDIINSGGENPAELALEIDYGIGKNSRQAMNHLSGGKPVLARCLAPQMLTKAGTLKIPVGPGAKTGVKTKLPGPK